MGSISVNSHNPCPWQPVLQCLFNSLRSLLKQLDMMRHTVGALLNELRPNQTMVAMKLVVRRVKYQICVAVVALCNPFTVIADDYWGKPTPIDEYQALLATFDPIADFVQNLNSNAVIRG